MTNSTPTPLDLPGAARALIPEVRPQDEGLIADRQLPPNAIGLRLHRFVGERLIACEPVYFVRGRPAVEIVLRRAAISGRVEIDGEVGDYFADVLTDQSGTWDATVCLDRNSYRALKTKWMRCKVDHDD